MSAETRWAAQECGPLRPTIGAVTPNDGDRCDLAAWGDPDVVRRYRTDGVTDPGEAAALSAAADAARGDVLDLGVGGGRTTRLLAPAARRYTGLDAASAMVELARARNPGVDLRVGDARDLSRYPDRGHDLVVFSYNGLDAVDHPGRVAALAEMHRVLRPGGRLVVSSLNIDGPSYDERPWTLRRGGGGARAGLRAATVALARAARHPHRQVRALGHYRRVRHLAEDGPGFSRRPLRAHEFRFVVHFASFGATVAMLRAAGLDVIDAWSEQGSVLDPSAARATADYVHYLCRRGDG